MAQEKTKEIYKLWRDSIESFIKRNPKLACYDVLLKLEDATQGKIPYVYFFAAAVTLLTFLILLVLGLEILIYLIGFTYPAYRSYKLILAQPTKEQSTQLLSYWTIFFLVNFVERTPFWILLSWVPFYSLIKLFLLVALYHPKTKVATEVYQRVVVPFVLPHLNIATTPKEAPAPATKKSGYGIQVSLSATDLPAFDGKSPDSWWVAVKVVPNEKGTRFKTSQATHPQNPEWKDVITIDNIPTLTGTSLECLVMSKETYGRDREVGKVLLPLSEITFKEDKGLLDVSKKLAPPEATSPAPQSGALKLSITATKY